MHRHLLVAAVAVVLAAAGCGSSQTAEGHTPGCDSCHGFPPATATAGNVIASHATAPGGAWEATDCNACHPTSVSAAGGTVPTAAGGTHLNGIVEAAGHAMPFADPALHGPAANANLASCKSCHGPNLDGGTAGRSCDECHTGGTAAWRTDCTFCHGDPARPAVPDALSKSAPPADVAGSLDPIDIGVGAHETHVLGGAMARTYACTTCHVVPANALDAGHMDLGHATLTWGGLAVTGGLAPAFDRTAATCATTYCHGGGFTNGGGSNTAPTWTSVGSGQAACGSCHALPITTAGHPQSFAGGQAWLAADCSLCHSASVNASGALLAPHLDGAQTPATPLTCTSCHDITAAPVSYKHTRVNAGATNPLACSVCHDPWRPLGHADGTAQLATSVDCATCHGDAAATPAPTPASPREAAPPVDVHGGNDAAKVGRHASHLDGALYSNGFACASCHPGVATYDVRHADGTSNVAFTSAIVAGGTYVAGSSRCDNTYCHGTFPGGTGSDPTWTGSVTCISCHPINATNPSPTLITGKHVFHVDGESIGCGTCHAGYTAAAVNRANHVNGVKNVAAGWDGASCSNGCHDTSKGTWY